MDRKSVIVLIICGVLFVLWAQLTPRLYPPPPVTKTNILAGATNAITGGTNLPVPLEATAARPFTSPLPSAPEELLVMTNDVARYTFTSHGGGLKMVELLKYPESVSCGSKQNVATNRVATLNGCFWHSKDDARLLTLSNGQPTSSLDHAERLRPIFAHSGHDDSNTSRTEFLRQTPEHHIR